MTDPRLHRVVRVVRVALLAALVPLASACIRGSLPAREYYRLAPPDSALRLAAQAPRPSLAGVVAIEPYATPGIYAAGGIIYRLGEAEYGVYPTREWAIPLGEMLGMLTERVLRDAPVTTGGAVFDPPSRRAQDYVWRGSVREFEEVSRGLQVVALARLDAQLVRTADDSVVWSGSATAELPVPPQESRSMRAVVDALSLAAARTVAQLVGEASRQLPRVAAGVAPER